MAVLCSLLGKGLKGRHVLARYVFRVHAVQRMFERGISVAEVRNVLEEGETIATYPDDKPYPSRLILGRSRQRPIHVVVADNAPDEEIVVVTVYQPDATLWTDSFRRRRE